MSTITKFNTSVVDNTAVTDTSTEVLSDDNSTLEAKASRRYALITNSEDSADTVFLAFGVDAEADKGIPLVPGASYELNEVNFTHASVNAICASGGTATVLSLVGTL